MDARTKLETLRGVLSEVPRALVAYSGGVDSAFLLATALDTVGRERVRAFTAISPSIAPEEVDAARALARSLGAEHVEVASKELEDPRYAANPSNRCFWCKTELYTRTAEWVAAQGGGWTVLDGTNLDDLSDHRPGREAAQRAGVRSPLVEARLTKDDIRALSRERGLPTWDKPSAPCLSSRIPYGTSVTEEKLAKIGAAESALRKLGFRSFRVRYHDSVARIEVDAAELPRLFEMRSAASRAVKEAGFAFVALDLDGLKSGALNVLASSVPPIEE